jgi:hypothetical protein
VVDHIERFGSQAVATIALVHLVMVDALASEECQDIKQEQILEK